jgi:hypothetical protein
MLKFTIPFLLAVASASATVTISFNADSLLTSGGAAEATTTLAFLVADAGGDGFGAINAGTINQYDIVGSGDVIVSRFDFSGLGTPGIIAAADSGIVLDGFTAGSQLAIVWMTGLTTGSASVANGQSYGLLTDASWVAPSDGFVSETYQVISASALGFFAPNATTLAVSDVQSQASFTVVPEPSTFAALAGLCALGAVMVRRRRA